MQLSNEIVLRPRFHMEIDESFAQVIHRFTEAKKLQSLFIISCLEDHIFIKIPKKQQHFWSPQLHLELTEISETKTSILGFYGPNPTVWTLFIFLHVVVGILFLANATWWYSNYKLGNPIILQISIAIIFVIAWVVLYFAGTIGKKKGKPDMRALHDFLITTLA